MRILLVSSRVLPTSSDPTAAAERLTTVADTSRANLPLERRSVSTAGWVTTARRRSSIPVSIQTVQTWAAALAPASTVDAVVRWVRKSI